MTGQSSERRRYFGKYPGTVVDNQPPDGEAVKRGEITVRVEGILEESPDGSSEQAIEVVARPCFAPGFFFIPKPESKVWVEFAAGDINQPLWVGQWYPRDAAPADVDGEQPTHFHKVIRTGAETGHVLLMQDEDDDPDVVRLVLRDETNDCTLTFDKHGLKLEALHADNKGKIELHDASDNHVVMDENGVSITGAGQSIVLDSNGITITAADNTVEITSSGITITLAGGGLLEVQ